MKNLKFIFLVICGISVLSAAQVYAFDGSRKGFVLGLAGGLSYTNYEHNAERLVYPAIITRKITAGYPHGDSALGLMTDFVLGYGITGQIVLQYTNKVAWFLKRDIDFVYGMSHINEDCLVVFGMSSLGVNYYFQRKAPSLYISGAIGSSMWNTPFVSDYNSKSGTGWSVGAGYEFRKHWSLELTVLGSTPEYNNISTEAMTVLIGIKGLAY